MASNRHSDNLAIWSHITSSLLASWINDKNSLNKLLIIDSRDTAEFSQLHIKTSINLKNSKIIRKSLRSEKLSIIELLLKNTTIGLVENKHDINIVVYDSQSEHSNQLDADKSFAFILLQKLVQKFKNVSFLTGGFVNFKTEHPLLVQSSQTLSTSSSSSSSSNSTLLNTDTNTPSSSTSTNTTPIAIFPYSNFENLTSPINVNKSEKSLLLSSSVTTSSASNMNNTNLPTKPNTLLSKTPMKPPLNTSISSFNIISDARNKFKNNSDIISLIKPAGFDKDSIKNEITQAIQVDDMNENDDMSLIRKPTKILDFLYLGSQEDALSEPTMKALNITYVLNVSISCPKACFISDANFLRIPVNDGHTAKILPFFDVAYRFIEKCRKSNNNVLIHCLAGISRSPTLAIAYLMKHQSLSSDEAYKFVKERRPTISPNFNFLGQLYEYEKEQEKLKIKESSIDLNNQSDKSSSADLSFLKFNKKSSFSSESIAASHNNEQQQRQKRFIFHFKNNAPLNNDLLIPSPSQEFSNFSLNSPTTNVQINLSMNNNSTNNELPATKMSQDIPKSLFLTKSLTVNSLKEIAKTKEITENNDIDKPTSNVVMRRPANLAMMSSNKCLNENSSVLSPTKTINTLKRPSSILLGLSNTNVFNAFSATNTPIKSPQQQNQPQSNQPTEQQNKPQNQSLSHQQAQDQSLKEKRNGLIASTLLSPASLPFCSSSSTSSSSTVTPLARTLSNTSASSSSSSCSCCSNVSSSSNSSSFFNQSFTYVCNSCSLTVNQQLVNTIGFRQQQQQLQEQQYQYQKKIKLSPINDKFNYLNSFELKTSTLKSSLDSSTSTLNSKCSFLSQKSSFNQVTTTPTKSFTTSSLIASFNDVIDKQEHQNANSKRHFVCNTQSILKNELESKFFLKNDNHSSHNDANKLQNFTTSSLFNEENIKNSCTNNQAPILPQNSFPNLILNINNTDRLQESKSLDTLKLFLDKTSIPSCHKIRKNQTNYEYEGNENNFNSDNEEENNENNNYNQRLIISMSEERILSNSSSLINLTSIQNSKMACSSTNSNNSAVIQKKSSSSSSSSKNSLHGSIETMIEVS